jgi:methyltransferase (TIGR00027 family)
MSSVEYLPSETALATATMRALAAHDPREEVRGPDYLAELFLTEEQKNPLKDAAKWHWVIKNKVAPGAYEFMIARTAFFDHLFITALDRRLPQLVLLGAGYDSRPYRFAHLLGDTHIFELDARATQARKKEMLERGSVHVPANVKFVPVDFGSDDLEQALCSTGFSRDQKALYLWEGVTYYLSAETVDKVLAGIRAISARASSIGFDCAILLPEALSEDGLKMLREKMISDHPTEPTRFGIPQGKLEAYLSKRGFTIIEIVDSAKMEAKYLTLKDGTILGKVPGLFSLVHAAVA